MHWQAYQYVTTIKSLLPEFFHDTAVLEVGSHNVNGGVRELFDTESYVGLDLSEGEGVDIVVSGHEYKSDVLFDVSISCECFEHNPHYQETLENMIAHTKDEGIVIFSCATTGRPEHGTSRTDPNLSPGTSSLGWDYYKNLTEKDFLNLQEHLYGWYYFENKFSQDIYFIGAKSKDSFSQITQIASSLKNYLSTFENISNSKNNAEAYLPFLRDIELAPSLLFQLKHQSSNSAIIQNTYFQKHIFNSYLFWPNTWQVNHLLSEIYDIEDDVSKALHFSRKSRVLNDASPFCINAYATLLAKNGKYLDAIQQLETILEIECNGPILLKVSKYYFEAKKYKEALHFVEKAVLEQPNDTVYLHSKLKILEKLDFAGEALKCANYILSMSNCHEWVKNYSLKVKARLSSISINKALIESK